MFCFRQKYYKQALNKTKTKALAGTTDVNCVSDGGLSSVRATLWGVLLMFPLLYQKQPIKSLPTCDTNKLCAFNQSPPHVWCNWLALDVWLQTVWLMLAFKWEKSKIPQLLMEAVLSPWLTESMTLHITLFESMETNTDDACNMYIWWGKLQSFINSW